MAAAFNFRTVLHFCLILLFVILMGIQFHTLLHPDIGTYTSMENLPQTFPAITVCPASYDLRPEYKNFPFIMRGNNMTFNEIMDKLKTPRRDFCMIALPGAMGDDSLAIQFDLCNETTLKELFNTTLDEVYSESLKVSHYAPYHMLRCVSFSTPKELTPQKYIMIASVNLTGMSLGLFEAHPRGNSLSNYEFDWENTIDTLMPDLISRFNQVKKSRYIQLNTDDRPCDEENKQESKTCLDKFMSHHLKCRLPWIEPIAGLETCNSPSQVDAFMNLSIFMSSQEWTEKAKEFGCLLPNCVRDSWKVRQYFEGDFEHLRSTNLTQVTFLTFQDSQVEVTKENLLYTFPNLLSDAGGFLGLLLGASVASIYDDLSQLWTRMHSNSVNKF